MTHTYKRYGVFFTPTGAFAAAGARWLGWDLATGQPVGEPDLGVVKRPQKYGFHGTIKPPFFLKSDRSLTELETAFAAQCADLSAASVPRLTQRRIGGFVALAPTGNTDALATLAGRVVSELDPFRTPPSDAELARRRTSKLSPAQDAHLIKWGYPYVFDQFKFHMTLSGNLKEAAAAAVLEQAKATFTPVLPTPMIINTLTLVGERRDGMFEQIARHTLGITLSSN